MILAVCCLKFEVLYSFLLIFFFYYECLIKIYFIKVIDVTWHALKTIYVDVAQRK